MVVADDNLVNQKLVARLLERVGGGRLRVVIAVDGHAALEAVRAHAATGTIALVLMDLSMPGMDGIEV